MNSDVVTRSLSRAEMNEELVFLADYFRRLGHTHCEVLFGFAWGNHYYPTAEWNAEAILLSDLSDEVLDVESAGFGSLGRDDLWLKVPSCDIEVLFCHESDLHLECRDSNAVFDTIVQVWLERGLDPKPVTLPTSS